MAPGVGGTSGGGWLLEKRRRVATREWLSHLARRLTGSETSADDAVQDVYVAVLRVRAGGTSSVNTSSRATRASFARGPASATARLGRQRQQPLCAHRAPPAQGSAHFLSRY